MKIGDQSELSVIVPCLQGAWSDHPAPGAHCHVCGFGCGRAAADPHALAPRSGGRGGDAEGQAAWTAMQPVGL